VFACFLLLFSLLFFYHLSSFSLCFSGFLSTFAIDSAVFLFVYYCVSVYEEVSLGFVCEIKQSSEGELAKERVREERIP
jgi:hypothetical protein